MSLEAFLNHYFYKFTQNQQSHVEPTPDIENAVKELIWRLLEKGLSLKVKDVIKESIQFDGTFRDILPVTNLIPIGSSVEHTRVGEPFEYDFMLLIDVQIHVQDGCGPGYVKVKYPSNKKWTDLPADQILHSWSYLQSEIKYPSIDAIFSILFETLTQDDLFMADEEKTVRTSSGVLKALQSGYSFHIAALWTDKDQNEEVVSIDIRPAFRCPQYEIDNQVAKGNLPHMLKTFAEEHGVFVVPKHCITPNCDRCFLISFATCEMELIKHTDDHHRKCYTVLKSMISPKDMFEDALTEVETYHIKTCLLLHYYKSYPSKCEQVSVENCVLSILLMVLESFREMKLSTFFLRKLSVFERSSYTHYKIDFIFPKNCEIARILKEHGDTDNELNPSIMYLASLKMTIAIIEMIYDVLLLIQTGKADKLNPDNICDAIEDLHFELGYHFTGTLVESVQRNKWLSYFKIFMNDIHHPILPILKSALTKNIPDSNDAIKTQFPLTVRTVTFPTPGKCDGNLVDYYAEFISGWFSIEGNDSSAINYHRKK